MSIRNPIGRRAWLAGAGSLCVGLPFLPSFGHAGSFGAGGRAMAAPPKRVVFLVTANGTNPKTHWPTGNETDFTLGQIMTPLDPYKDRMVVLRGVDNKAAMATGINGHTDAIRCMFTGRKAANNDNVDYTAAGGISIDQFIANDVGASTMFKSLEFERGVYASTWPNWTSFYGASQPAPFESDAQKFWDRIFAGVQEPGEPDPALVQLQADRKSVLDAVQEQYGALQKRVSADDKQRLDAHLEMVRDLERRIADTDLSSACIVPGRPATNTMEDGSLEGIDLVAYALSCDLTRVATIAFRHSGYGFLGVTGSYHDDWLHHVNSDPAAETVVNTVKTWECEQVLYVLDKLASIPEGTGTLLDNTLVVWSDEFCHGYAHQHHEVPYVLVSGSDNFFEMGRYLQFGTARSNNELWISIAQAMGVDGAFGDPQFGSTPLPGLA